MCNPPAGCVLVWSKYEEARGGGIHDNEWKSARHNPDVSVVFVDNIWSLFLRNVTCVFSSLPHHRLRVFFFFFFVLLLPLLHHHPPPPGCSFSSFFFSLFPSFFLLLYLASLWSQQEPGCISEHHPSVIASCFVNFRQTGSFTFLACIFEMEKRRVQVPSSASCQKMRMVLRLLQAD